MAVEASRVACQMLRRRLRGPLDRTLAALGYRLVPLREAPAGLDEADRDTCLEVAPFTMTSPRRVAALCRAVRHVVRSGIGGAIVECGVWRGGSMMAAARTLLALGEADRDLYLFDTFGGMTAPGAEDVLFTGEPAAELLRSPLGERIAARAGLDDVRGNVLGTGYPSGRVHFVEGPVEDTVPRHAPERIALLRLDTDWYASTRHELEHLYPRLAPGGVLIVDDYCAWLGARQATDEYLDRNAVRLLLHPIDDTGVIAVKPG